MAPQVFRFVSAPLQRPPGPSDRARDGAAIEASSTGREGAFGVHSGLARAVLGCLAVHPDSPRGGVLVLFGFGENAMIVGYARVSTDGQTWMHSRSPYRWQGKPRIS
jgi:hypothetical protein